MRDVGALNLALLVVLAVAAFTMSRPMINVAAAAAAVWGVPHVIYHLFNTGGLSNGDIVPNLGGLLVAAVMPFALVMLNQARAMSAPTSDQPEPGRKRSIQ